MILADNSDPAIAIVVGSFVLAAIFFAFLVSRSATKKRNQQLEQLARKYGGQVESGGLLGLPKMQFPHAGRTVLLSYLAQGDEGRNYQTSLTIPWPSRKLRCEIFPESAVSTLRKLIGMQDIQIGSPWFDDQFVITGNDEAAIKALLTPEVQAHLGQLHRLKTGHGLVDHVFLRISGGSLTITKVGYLDSLTVIEPFIRLFLDLFDAAALIPTPGIVFLATPSAAVAPAEAAPHCIVCGEPLTTDLVSCRSCKTPHHRDCWQYFGGCATYACGGKQLAPK